MTNNPDFDIYPGLDRDIQAASDEVADTSGLDKVVGEQLRQPGPNLEGLSKEARSWAVHELDYIIADSAMRSWHRYEGVLGTDVPARTNELLQQPRMGETIQGLYEAKKALRSTGLETAAGENIGDTMSLVVVPWQAFRNNLDRIDDFEVELRKTQGVTVGYSNSVAIEALKNDEHIYRNPANSLGLMTPSHYLDHKIHEDGPWGVMLMQASKDAGCTELEGVSPNKLTGVGLTHLNLGQQYVDAMGFFEWMALSLQEKPEELSPEMPAYLLANRKLIDGVGMVGGGYWNMGGVNYLFYNAGGTDPKMQPRLAVA